MKKTLLLVLLSLSVLLAGCPSTPESTTVEDRTATTGSGDGSGNDTSVKTITPETMDGTGLPAILKDPKNILSKRSIYFDYDKYDVRAEYRDLVSAHAKFLSSNQLCKMLIQGNTDERGSSEYNLALGQKRSDAVKRALLLSGVKEEQIESVSLGKEKPKNLGHDDAAWAENRRGDMLYRCEKGGEF